MRETRSPANSRRDYCDRFVEAIYSQKKTVELAGFSEVPIVRLFSSRKRKKKLVPGEDESDERKGEQISPKVRVARSTTIEPGTQRVVECTSKRAGLVVVRPYSSLYEKYGLICTNGLGQVQPDRPFLLLVANFRQYPLGVKKAMWWRSYYCTREPCSRAKPPLAKFSEFKKGRGKIFRITSRSLRARQEANR